MKIQCDVCEKAEAAVFCTADEAALCGGCDKKVHHANKLAGKHLRFSLLEPSFSGHAPPLCDICQERRAFLFCREDRAILCRECDISIHKTNEHTKNHSRFLLTGVKLSSSSYPYPTNASCPSSSTSSDPNSNRMTSVINNVPSYDNDMFSQYSYTSNSSDTNPLTTTAPTTTINYNQINQEGSMSTSDTISGYLETLPEWRLEDLLPDHSSASDHNLCKTFDCTNTRVVNEGQVEEVMSPFGSEDYSRIWEFYNEGPHVPSSHLPPIFLRTFS